MGVIMSGKSIVVVTAADLLSRKEPSSGSLRARPGPKKGETKAPSHLVAPQTQRVGLYQAKHSILVVGDGNLSFSLSLASFLGGANIVSRAMIRSKFSVRSIPRLLEI